MRTRQASPLSALPPGNLALGVPALCCACEECAFSVTARISPELEAMAASDIPGLLRALPGHIALAMKTFGEGHQKAAHHVSLGLIYLVPMVGAEAEAESPKDPLS